MTEPRIFRPSIGEDRTIRAGGLPLAELDDQQGTLVFQDRYQRRCYQRGTPNVRVSLYDLLDVLLAYFEEQNQAGY